MALIVQEIGDYMDLMNPDDYVMHADDEAQDRNDFHIEDLAEEFARIEAPLRHNKLPESDDEDDCWRNRREGERGVRYNMGRGDGNLRMKQAFFNGVAFKESVLDYALKTGRNLKQYRYDKEKLGFRCVGLEGKCKWMVYASSLPNDPVWRVRKYVDHHICIPNGQCEMFKVPVIARLFVDKIRDEPEYYLPAKMEQIIKERWKVSVSRSQCQAARRNALKWIQAEYDEQFSRLRDYGAEIVESNPGSTVVIETVKDDADKDVFSRFYVCYDVLRKTWKTSCRPLIGVDGCFLKSKVKGQLLVALSRDANNGIYPIAWSIVQVENKENWACFVKLLKADFGLDEGEGYVMVSDRQKGLILAVEKELTKIEHRKCVQHIYGNLKKDHPGKKGMKQLLWRLAWSYNETEYKEALDRIFQYDTSVYDGVMKRQPKTWCRAFYKLGSYCEDVENNSTESFNATINKAREKPFIAMLECVRRLAMIRISRRKDEALAHEGLCTPYVDDFLKEEHEKPAECMVSRSTNDMWEVRLGGDYHRVALERRFCTCRKYQICGIPCEHAYGVILHKKFIVEHYVSTWFSTAMYRKNYEHGIIPHKSARFWPSSGDASVEYPADKEGKGKDKVTKEDKKRKRGVNESPMKKAPKLNKRTVHCRVCGVGGHNSRFHKKNSTQASQTNGQGEPSQPEPSQGEPSQGIFTQI